MSKKPADDFNYLSNDPDFVPNPEIEEFMEEEIARAPRIRSYLRTGCGITPRRPREMPAGISMPPGKM